MDTPVNRRARKGLRDIGNLSTWYMEALHTGPHSGVQEYQDYHCYPPLEYL